MYEMRILQIYCERSVVITTRAADTFLRCVIMRSRHLIDPCLVCSDQMAPLFRQFACSIGVDTIANYVKEVLLVSVE